MDIKKKQLLGAVVGLVAMSLAWYWFSWKLTLIILLALFGNNLERSSNK